MLFSARFWPGLRDGTITVAFRRWKQPRVRAGRTLQTPAGLLQIETVDQVDITAVTTEELAAAGHPSIDDLQAMLRPDGDLYRVRFHVAGPDPRIALRESTELTPDELAAVQRSLARLPWAYDILRIIGNHPSVVSTELAPMLGLERLPFKQRVRRLKALGLTESLDVGYRLSPRGEVVLAAQPDADH